MTDKNFGLDFRVFFAHYVTRSGSLNSSKQCEAFLMSLCELLLTEFDDEMAGTRKTLERVPENKFGWKPHEKSGSMIWLASHLAHLPEWAAVTMQQDSLDMSPNGVSMPQPPAPKATKEVLEIFDKNVKAGRAALAGGNDSELSKPWSLLDNGKVLFTMPRGECLRKWVLNHNVHHRAQLGVYLRLNNIPVPALYGPSADEQGM
jgi:uncharacterized damage-inducible protein DinB